MELEIRMTDEEKKDYNNEILKSANEYCYCRGLGSGDIDDLYIGCDSDKVCVNGGWYHWKCVPEFRGWTKEEIEKIEMWICPECRDPTNEAEQAIKIEHIPG